MVECIDSPFCVWHQFEKRATAENGSDGIHYQEYDENMDITSIVIPISRKYLQYSYRAMDLATKDQNFTSKDQNLDFDEEKIKINNVDAIAIINRSTYSDSIRKTLTAIFDRFFSEEFSRSDIVSYLNARSRLALIISATSKI